VKGSVHWPRGTVAVSVGILLALAACAPKSGAQENDGSVGTAIGGALLGAYSGSVLGLIGGFGPCNRTLSGSACPRIAVAVGGGLGLASGLRLEAEDLGALNDRWRSAGYGAAIGGLVGYGLSLGVRQYGWRDVATFMAVGAGIGASPKGAGIGFAAGAAVGALGWMGLPNWKIGDAVAVSLVGLAAGGLAGWVTGPDGGNQRDAIVLPLQVRF